MKNVGERIKKVRTILKMSQQDLANELNVTKQAISNIENSKCAPSLALLSKLLIDYNVNLNFIIGNLGAVFLEDKKTNQSIRDSIMDEVMKMLDERGIK